MAKKTSRSEQEKIEKIDEILLLCETMSCAKACEKAEVPHSTFATWKAENKAIHERYARANEHYISVLAQEIMDISDERPPKTIAGSTDGGYVNDKRLRVDSRKWLLSKIAPKQYGDKLDLSSSDGSMSFSKIERVIVTVDHATNKDA